MGLEFFAQQCGIHSTETDALVWCVTKEGACCGICPDTLASIGTRVGLSVAVFFATVVITIDAAETPFVFLTTALQALAYLVVVLWEGLGGKGISRFHSYYALFCSFGWLAPLAAASLTATHYGYGGTHPKSGDRLPAYRTDQVRSWSARQRASALGKSLANLDHHPSPNFTRGSQQQSGAHHGEETVESDTFASLLGLTRSYNYDEIEKLPAEERKKDLAIRPIPRTDTIDSEASVQAEVLRRRLGQSPSSSQRANSSQPLRQPSREDHPERRSHETVYSPEQLKEIARSVAGSRWRRYGYPASIVSLWIAWLFTYLLIDGKIPGFSLAQTNCADPEGTDVFKRSSELFLAAGPLIAIVFLLNYHTQWLFHQLRRIFDFNRHGSLLTRLVLPGIFSGIIFTIWQALLWHGYRLAARPESSLLASTEQSATFATVLSLALTIKPVTDLVKALAKIHKRKLLEREEAESPVVPGGTPTVLPDLRLPEIDKFKPLEAPAIPAHSAVDDPLVT
ncbi:hypothetical protein JCM3766R1_004978 [Sporobolomyces carnicolor]